MSDNMLAGLQAFSSEDWKVKTKGLLDEIDRLDKEYPDSGFKEVLSYDLIWGDFKKAKNWGWKGRPYLIDAGTLCRDELDPSYIEHLQPRWFEIVKARREARENGNAVLTKSIQSKHNLDLIEKANISMDADELVEEHEHLVKILESGTEEERKKEASKQKKELAEYREQAEKKGHVNFDQNNENYNPEKLDTLYTEGIKKNNPLILDISETPTEDKLIDALKYILNESEKKIVELISQEVRPNKVGEIKSLRDIIEAIKNFFNISSIRGITDSVMNHVFMEGWDRTEEQLQRNIDFNKEALDFIKNYTFENIQGMTKEIMEDLRQELERGMMEGDTIAKLTERIQKVFDSGRNRAEMIAITETHRAEEEGKRMAFKFSGENYKKKFVTHYDDRTCEICKRMDGQTVDLNESFKDKTSGWESQIALTHPRCRCTTIFVKEGE
jgi:SPP1 gp7 family putative phage head morphogenesis protein